MAAIVPFKDLAKEVELFLRYNLRIVFSILQGPSTIAYISYGRFS